MFHVNPLESFKIKSCQAAYKEEDGKMVIDFVCESTLPYYLIKVENNIGKCVLKTNTRGNDDQLETLDDNSCDDFTSRGIVVDARIWGNQCTLTIKADRFGKIKW